MGVFIYIKEYKNVFIFMYMLATMLLITLSISYDYIDYILYPKWVYFQISIGIGVMAVVFVQKNNVKYSNYDLLVLGCFCFFIIWMFFRNYGQFNLIKGFLCIECYCIIRICKEMQKLQLELSFVIVGIILSIIGLYQLINGRSNIIGKFDNTAGYVFTLSVSYVASIHFAKIHYYRKRIIWQIFAAVFTFAIVLSQSRIGIIVCLVIPFFYHFRTQYILIVTAVLLLAFSMTFKTDSSNGRFFIYRTSISLLNRPNKMLLGLGEDGFSREYMIKQSDNLKKQEFSKYRSLAGNVHHPISDVLLFFLNFGLIGFIVMLFVFSICFVRHKKQPHTNSYAFVLALFALLSYPFHYPIAWLLLSMLYDSSGYATIKTKSLDKYLSFLGKCVIFLIGLSSIAIIIEESYWQRKWCKNWYKYQMAPTAEVFYNYEDIFKKFKNNPEFLFNYASVLHASGNDRQAKRVLDRITINDYDVQMLYAKIYKSLGNIDQSEENLIRASNMCPSRFLPLFELYQQYKELSDIERQIEMGTYIINKPEKIKTNYIRNKKQEIYSELNRLEK